MRSGGMSGIEAREGGSGVLRHVRARASQIDRVGLLIGDKQSGSVSTNFHFSFHFPFPADAVKVPGRAGGRFRPPSAPPPH